MSSEPPEEPQYRNELSILSPASPKPIHFPTPTNIHVLEMQHDVSFNQTEAHMNDPAARNTEVRPDLWRDPNESEGEASKQPSAAEDAHTSPTADDMQESGIDHVTPYSTGADFEPEVDAKMGEEAEDLTADAGAHSTETAAADLETTATNQVADPQPVPLSTTVNESPSEPAVGTLTAPSATSNVPDPSSDPSVPTAESVAAAHVYDAPSHTDVQASNASPAFTPNPVDVQALLDTLQTASSNPPGPLAAEAGGAPAITADASSQQQPTSYMSSPVSASGLSAPPSGLPPRPPPQEQPLIHPNYVHSQHIRDYHPHAANPAFQPHQRSGSQGNVADPSTRNYVPPVGSPTAAQAGSPTQAQPLNAYTAPTQAYASGPLSAQPYAATPNSVVAASANAYGGIPSYGNPMNPSMAAPGPSNNTSYDSAHPGDQPWDLEVQKKYDRFIEEERKYVSEGRWEQFPNGARLFVGNLSSEKVTKRDIFHVFHPYGDLAQISIKQAYGFVQFLRTEDCMRAMEAEQGTQIRDKRIHLEVSKPQKNRQQPPPRRSRSPDGRGRPMNVDRYNPGSRVGNNSRRDGYRPGYRSPSPRGYRDRYDDRYRARSRSPPGYGRGEGRYRSPSPRREVDDGLPLPKRDPRDVPDVQIIVMGDLDRDFTGWVERAFTSRGVRADVLILSPRLQESAVIRRQIVEGVAAVVKLDRQNQASAKISLQIFDRRNGVSNVTFEEYDGLDPHIAVELVLRAKSTHVAPQSQPTYAYGSQQQNYGGYSAPPPAYPAPMPAYNQPPQSAYPPTYNQPPPPAGSVPPNLQNIITNLDPNNLQNLLSAMNTPQSGNAPYGAPASAVQALQQNPAMVGYLQQQQQAASQGQPGGQVNMQDILARLGSGGGGYGR